MIVSTEAEVRSLHGTRLIPEVHWHGAVKSGAFCLTPALADVFYVEAVVPVNFGATFITLKNDKLGEFNN